MFQGKKKIFFLVLFFFSQLTIVTADKTFLVHLIHFISYPKLFQRGDCLCFHHLPSNIFSLLSNLLIPFFRLNLNISHCFFSTFFYSDQFQTISNCKNITRDTHIPPHLTSLDINFSACFSSLTISSTV